MATGVSLAQISLAPLNSSTPITPVGDPTPHANVGVNRFQGACLRMRDVVALVLLVDWSGDK